MTVQRFRRDALFLIAGPCVLEDDGLNLRVAEHLARLADRVPGGIIFKASFDKANRSNAGAFRGPGLDEGLAALDRVRAATDAARRLALAAAAMKPAKSGCGRVGRDCSSGWNWQPTNHG